MRCELRLKELRTERGMTQRDVAEAIGVSPVAVCQWETGVTRPTVTNILAMSAALHCSVDDLLRPKATASAPT